MSTIGRRGPTTRAASRAASEPSSVGDDAPADQRASKAGSARSKRSQAKSRDNKIYGSQLAAAGAQRMAAAAAELGSSDAIHATLHQAQADDDEPTAQVLARQLAPVHEEGSDRSSESYEGIASREGDEIINQAIGEEQLRVDQAIEDARRANTNQPPEGTSVLQKQITFLSSDTSIDRPLSSYFQLKHYFALGTFLLVLAALFADIYRGPLLGARFDALKHRFDIGNHTVEIPWDVASIQERMRDLERKVWRLNQDASDARHTNLNPPINFFSQLHGMAVEARLTSPTAKFWLRRGDDHQHEAIYEEPTWFEKYIYPGYITVVVTPNGPATVFAPWDESSGYSWCAAAGDGKLQLAVAVDGPMTPTELVIEHNPNTKQINPKKVSAPKEVELWIQILDDNLRESIGRDVTAIYGDFKDPGSSAVAALPQEYVPVGRWVYNFRAPEFVQAFRIRVDLRSAHIYRVAVRINSNWANDPFTCLYRLRLHGSSRHPDFGPWTD
ncbi:MAG: hypothetical protein Q9216_002367 [Gyalolechia sp. 2 TL-2023]